MKQIYSSDAFQMIPCQNGFIFVVKERQEEKTKISYKMLDFEHLTMTPVTRNVYLLTKFGNHFESFDFGPEDFLPYRTLFLPDHRLLAVAPNGKATVYSGDNRVVYKGDLSYDGCAPDSLVLGEDCFFASYKQAGVIVKYRLHNMRRELRYGGPSGELPAPEGLHYQLGKVLFCAPDEHKIMQLDPVTFQVEEYHKFDQPVHQYIKYHANEIVLLDSGIFKL